MKYLEEITLIADLFLLIIIGTSFLMFRGIFTFTLLFTFTFLKCIFYYSVALGWKRSLKGWKRSLKLSEEILSTTEKINELANKKSIRKGVKNERRI